MRLDPALVDALFARHGVSGAWEELPATGVANRIFATRDIVLRVATDHPEAVPDARTESVAAPVAHAAGVLTPRLIAFDDTRTLVERPFSLWERVHGATLGLANLSPAKVADVWRAVGRELAKLHTRVRECADPNGYLDQPSRDEEVGAIDVEPCFVHDDIHPMNIMCSTTGALMAILDWGDAGWGDPALDFASMPREAVGPALEGYAAETSQSPSAAFVARVARYRKDSL